MKPPVACRRGRERGALLGVVMVLIAVLLGASVIAVFSLRSDTGAAGRERMSRQLFDCAEQGLAFGKQYFSGVQRPNWDAHLAADVCAFDGTLCAPYGPFPTGMIGAAPTNYPGGSPYTTLVPMGLATYRYTVAIYNNPEQNGGVWVKDHDGDNTIVVYSRCSEVVPAGQIGQSRAVQAIINVPPVINDDYTAQAGRGFRNQGNGNY